MLLSEHMSSFHDQSASAIDINNYRGNHLMWSSPVFCNLCCLIFNDMNTFQLHAGLYHSEQSQPAEASYPKESPEEILTYNENIASSIGVLSCYTCEVCRISFPLHEDIERHLIIEHSDQGIPQVDGIDHELYEFADVPPPLVRTASFSLN